MFFVTHGFKEQNQAIYMCVQEVHTYNNRKEQYQKQCYITKTYVLIINTHIRVSWNNN